MPSSRRWCCCTSLSSFGSTGRAFPFHPARQTSFSIPLALLQQPGQWALYGAGVAPGWWVQSLSPGPLSSPLTWCEHGQVTLLWLEHLLTSPWVWALILAWNFILTELIPDCFRLQKLVSDKAVFNKDIRGKELCWLDRALPCWALLCRTRRRSPPSTLPSCSLAAWWSRRHKGGGGWYLFLPDKKIATKYLYTDGWKQYTEPE